MRRLSVPDAHAMQCPVLNRCITENDDASFDNAVRTSTNELISVETGTLLPLLLPSPTLTFPCVWMVSVGTMPDSDMVYASTMPEFDVVYGSTRHLAVPSRDDHHPRYWRQYCCTGNFLRAPYVLSGTQQRTVHTIILRTVSYHPTHCLA